MVSRELPTRDPAGAPDRASLHCLRWRFSLEYHGGMAKKLSDLEMPDVSGTPQARTWISLVPGWIVRDGPDGIEGSGRGTRGTVH